ncbi:MAG: hypothetical protein Q7T87_05045 [Polaromonas sp.]|nr:hypothetical protein [Polaromonas sp.]
MTPSSPHSRFASSLRLPNAILLIVLLMLCYPASRWLPLTWGWENGPVENLQFAVLLAGMVLALVRYSGKPRSAVSMLALAAAPVWAILAARELSWGAVFLTPNEVTAEGPVFASSLLWYKPAVAPLSLLLLAFSAFIAVRWRLDRLLVRAWRQKQFPLSELLLMLLLMFVSGCSEAHMGCSRELFHTQNQVLEELVELVAYLAIVLAQWRLFRLTDETALPAA